MEIPGLGRLKSPENLPPKDTLNAAAIPQSHGISTDTSVPESKPLPTLKPSLEARIALMREEVRQKNLAKQSVQTHSESTSSPASLAVSSRAVNFSILDKALAANGLETIDDSDEEMASREASSSDDSSSDVSSEESDSDDEDSEVERSEPLTAAERERILIAADNDGPETAEIPRTKNELLEDEEPVRVPDFTIDENEPIELLGIVTNIVGRTCVVTGAPSPTSQVLDVGSLLVFENRTNLGFVADTFGPVILPMFSVRFNSQEALESADVVNGKQVFLVPKHAYYVFSDTLRVKGTDASNIHDEEQSEAEFSDDEQEALYKSLKKQQRRGAKNPDRPGDTVQPQMSRPLTDLEAIAQAQGLAYGTTNGGTYSAIPRATGMQTHSPFRGRSSRGRGAPRTGHSQNNHRHPQPQDRPLLTQHIPIRPDERGSRTFQRAFYEDKKDPLVGPQASPPLDKPSPSPALYQPLQRPQ